MIYILKRITKDKIMYINREKVYAWRQTKNKDGEEYIYSNYMVFFDKDILDCIGVTEHVYLYNYEGTIYLTGSEPEDVEFKRLRVNTQRGNKVQRANTVDPGRDWKRFFVVPRKFFTVNDDSVVVFTVDFYERDMFTGCVPRVSMTIE